MTSVIGEKWKLRVISVITENWKGIVIYKKSKRKYQFFKLIKKWKEIVISKFLFPSTPYFLRDLKVEGNSNENGRK